jgi:transcriptional regulator with XRE-family HTH domain
MSVATRTPQPILAVLALRGLKQSRIAAEVGVSARWLGLCLNGKQRPSEVLVKKLSELLDMPRDELFIKDEHDIVIAFVKRTTGASDVPERLDDRATIEQIAQHMRGGSA